MKKSARKTNSQTGWVHFPVDDPRYQNTNEGGMFVRIVALEKDLWEWSNCCGVEFSYLYNENLIGDEEPFFPNLDRRDDPVGIDRFLSIEHLCVLSIGSTGWSGWDGENYWQCQYADLTDEGKKLFDQVSAL